MSVIYSKAKKPARAGVEVKGRPAEDAGKGKAKPAAKRGSKKGGAE